MNKAERRAYQEGLEADMLATGEARAREEQPRGQSRNALCPAGGGCRHDFTMRGPDKQYRCWFCVKTRAQVEQELSR